LKNEAKNVIENKPPIDKNLTENFALIASSFFIAISVAVFRIGGRTALVQLLGKRVFVE
jgi:hypothetical protein